MADSEQEQVNPGELLRWIHSEIEDKKRRYLLGQTGPDVEEERKDAQAEFIQLEYNQVKRVVDDFNSRESHTSGPWYLLQGILEFFNLNEDKAKLTERAKLVANRTFRITKATAHFRERYALIYKAAFYAMLPDGNCSRVVRVEKSSVAAEPSHQTGLTIEQSRDDRYSHLVLTLDAAHEQDLRLVSLSAEMARLLEQARIDTAVASEDIKQLIYSVGRVFQDFLGASSKGNVFSRISLTHHFEIISRIINSIDILLNPPRSDNPPSRVVRVHPFVDVSLARQKQMQEYKAAQQRIVEDIVLLEHLVEPLISFTMSEGSVCEGTHTSSAEHLTFSVVARRLREHTLSQSELTVFSGSPNLETVREGSYASVYKIKLPGERKFEFTYSAGSSKQIRWSTDTVAVKVLHDSAAESALALRAFREFLIWSEMRHPHIVPLMGIWPDLNTPTGLPALVSPWIKHGSLSFYLSRKRRRLTKRERLRLLLDIASALSYMHNRQCRVCHGDINPENILVIQGRAFLCDFGISRISPPFHGLTTSPHGDWRYRAPEQLQESANPTPQSDMYSFGLVCYNVLTNLSPWDASEITEGDRIREPTIVIPRPESMSKSDYRFLRYCWETDPRLRVTAKKAGEKLEKLITTEIQHV